MNVPEAPKVSLTDLTICLIVAGTKLFTRLLATRAPDEPINRFERSDVSESL